MKKLGVIINSKIQDYLDKGLTSEYLKEYYNPEGFFDEVYIFSPVEKFNTKLLGMKIINLKLKNLKKLIKKFGINIIRAYNGSLACDIACLNKVTGVPVIVSVHTSNPVLHKSIKRADFVFCVSKIVQKVVLQTFENLKRIWLLPNRVNLEIMHPILKSGITDLNKKFPFKYKILHVGRKSYEKNLDQIIKALKFLSEDYCLIAIGRGNLEFYVRLAKEIGVSDHCFFIDVVQNDKLPEYYSWADCICNPSKFEGFGVVFIEALACEAIIITSNIPPMNEFIEHMKNGLLIKETENPQLLAELIELACTDQKLRHKIKSNARKSVEMFEKSRIDTLEKEYYRVILEMTHKNSFKVSIWDDIWQSFGNLLLKILPKKIRNRVFRYFPF